jgi:hypothetical protein
VLNEYVQSLDQVSYLAYSTSCSTGFSQDTCHRSAYGSREKRRHRIANLAVTAVAISGKEVIRIIK